MDLPVFAEKLEDAIRQNAVAVFGCSCRVEYSGRAESVLERGDRVIVVKKDNTVLVHQPTGSTPINYMKQDSKVEVDLAGDVVEIRSRNLQYKDYLFIKVHDVYFYNAEVLTDGAELSLVGTEADMSDMIRENPALISSEFKPLSREEHTKYGFIDVFGHDGSGNLVIVECKRYVAGLSAVQQLRRYVEKIVSLRGILESQVRGVVAAPSIAANAKDMLENWGFSYVRVEPPKRLEQFNKSQQDLSNFF